MDRYEYMRMKLTDFPENFQYQYNLQAHAKNGYVYIEIRGPFMASPKQVNHKTYTHNKKPGHMDIM